MFGILKRRKKNEEDENVAIEENTSENEKTESTDTNAGTNEDTDESTEMNKATEVNEAIEVNEDTEASEDIEINEEIPANEDIETNKNIEITGNAETLQESDSSDKKAKEENADKFNNKNNAGDTNHSNDTDKNKDIADNTDASDTINDAGSTDADHAENDIPHEPVKEKKGFFKRLVSGLTKTRDNIVSGIDSIFNGFSSIDDDFYEEIEEILIMGDIGVHATEKIIEDLKQKVKENKIKDPKECKQLLIDSIKEQMNIGENAYEFENRKSIILVIGVNGVGKTTSVGKLAAQLKAKGNKVILAAADTFRAAAIEQLTEWANRAGTDIIAQQEGADPGAVVFDAIQAAKARKADILICDTAGRLHNKKNLMEELKKIDRIIEKEYSGIYRETFIVLDGTTGQNALSQAKQFMECADITGVILTKMDGTAKGGIAVAIQSELAIPVKYIGIGEKIDDLQKFDADSFVDALFDVKREEE